MNNDYLVKISNLTKSYGKDPALDNVNLLIPKGRIIGLLGPNGSGKTTLIKILNGLIPYSSGEVIIDNKKIGIGTKRVVSYLPERTYLDEGQKVKDAIQYFVDFYDDFDKEKAIKLVNSLGIDLNKTIKTLSKGTKEKVQLILVMSRRAKLYLLDEPIAGVDPAARDYILHTIMQNFNEGATLIISTHLIYDIEKILDDVIFIRNGKIVLHDSADNIRSEHDGSIEETFKELFRCY